MPSPARSPRARSPRLIWLTLASRSYAAYRVPSASTTAVQPGFSCARRQKPSEAIAHLPAGGTALLDSIRHLVLRRRDMVPRTAPEREPGTGRQEHYAPEPEPERDGQGDRLDPGPPAVLRPYRRQHALRSHREVVLEEHEALGAARVPEGDLLVLVERHRRLAVQAQQ